MSRQQQIHVVIPCDGVHQLILKDGQLVAQADSNAAYSAQVSVTSVGCRAEWMRAAFVCILNS